MNRFRDMIQEDPVIAAVNDEAGLDEALRNEELRIIFILYGDVRKLQREILKNE